MQTGGHTHRHMDIQTYKYNSTQADIYIHVFSGIAGNGHSLGAARSAAPWTSASGPCRPARDRETPSHLGESPGTNGGLARISEMASARTGRGSAETRLTLYLYNVYLYLSPSLYLSIYLSISISLSLSIYIYIYAWLAGARCGAAADRDAAAADRDGAGGVSHRQMMLIFNLRSLLG